MVTTFLSTLYPQHVRGLHLNMMPGTTGGTFLKTILSQTVPGLKYLIIDKEDQDKDIFPVGFLLQETGYMHIQVTAGHEFITIQSLLFNNPFTSYSTSYFV